MHSLRHIQAVGFDWGNTLMSEEDPQDRVMALWPEVRAIPGASECLSRLSKRVPLFIATNASASPKPMIWRALERVGFAHYFQEVFCFTQIGFKKNQPEFWQAVSNHLAVPLPRIAMVGDSLEHDCLAPRSFGVQAFWFNEDGRHVTPAVPVPTVTSLAAFASSVEDAA